jgi:uroporphyrinogen III methyltransferase/synthase
MSGIVYLIGAGPGDIGLLTLKAVELIKNADVLVYDRLINEDILKMAKKDAELIDVGKFPDNHKVPQSKINEIIAKKALSGKKVARIKGGDPFVFGRGGEEAEYLSQKRIPYEVVPGITSAVAVLSYAGIPVTHRDLSSSFHVITGHEREGKDKSLNWEVISKLDGTLVFLMGIKNIEKIVQKLLNYGKDPYTPAAVVMEGTTPKQKVVTGKLIDIPSLVRKEGIKNPGVFAVGDVVALRDRLKWYENKKLFGKRILLTRTYEQSQQMKKILSEEGADVVICPTIKITPFLNNIEMFLEEIHKFDYAVFTSVNSVRSFIEASREKRFDLRNLSIKVVAIGSKTAEALENIFIYPDIIPEEYTSYSLANALKKHVEGKNIVLLTSQIGGDILMESLGNCANVQKIVAYKNEPNYEIKGKLISELRKGIDIAVFTSSSTFNYMHQLIGDEINLLKNSKIAAIGPVTKKAIDDKGFNVDIMPSEYTTEKLIEEILKNYQNQ